MMGGPSDRAAMPAGYEFIRVLGQGATGWVALARHVRRRLAFVPEARPGAVHRRLDEGLALE